MFTRGLLLVFACMSSLGMAEVHTVSQKGKTFSVKELTIKVGDSIIFKNEDDTPHNVFSSNENTRFNLRIQPPGTQNEQKFEKAGEGDIRCAIHPNMKIKLVVKE